MRKMYKIFALIVLSHSILIHTMDPLGTFTPVPGSPYATGANAYSVAFSPLASGNLFAAVGLGNQRTRIYEVNQTTGVFTLLSITTTPQASNENFTLTFSPIASGNLFLAVASPSVNNHVYIYKVNQTNGLLTDVPYSPFTTTGPNGFAFSPITSSNQLFAAVSNFALNEISVYEVDQDTGFLDPVYGSPFFIGAGAHPNSIAFSPLLASGQLFAAVCDGNTNKISVYKVNQDTGFFTEVDHSPFATPTEPNSIAFSPVVDGNLFAAVTNTASSVIGISIYKVDQDTGFFTAVPSSPFITLGTPSGVAFSPAIAGSLFVAASMSGNAVAVYEVNTGTGFLTEVYDSPFATGSSPAGIAFSPDLVDDLPYYGYLPNTLFAAVPNKVGQSVSVYSVTTPLIPPIPPIPPTPPEILLFPPNSVQGCKTQNVFLLQTDFINNITWTAPTSGEAPVAYALYRDPALTELIATIPATSPLQYYDHNRQPSIVYSYYIASIDSYGYQSTANSVTVTQLCF